MESRRPVLMAGPATKDGMTVSSSTMRLMVGRAELEKLFCRASRPARGLRLISLEFLPLWE